MASAVLYVLIAHNNKNPKAHGTAADWCSGMNVLQADYGLALAFCQAAFQRSDDVSTENPPNRFDEALQSPRQNASKQIRSPYKWPTTH